MNMTVQLGTMSTATASEDWFPNLGNLIPVAPLRSKPKRTYDPIRENSCSPEGGAHSNAVDAASPNRSVRSWELAPQADWWNSAMSLDCSRTLTLISMEDQMSDPFQLEVNVRSGLASLPTS